MTSPAPRGTSSIAHTATKPTEAKPKRTRGRPNAQRPARINARISQAAADHLQTIRCQHPGTLAATLEMLILQFPVEINKETNILNQHS